MEKRRTKTRSFSRLLHAFAAALGADGAERCVQVPRTAPARHIAGDPDAGSERWAPAETACRTTHMRPGALAEHARRLLDGLGPTPDAVAQSLFAARARGRPGDPGDTPLGAYVSAVVGADPDVGSVVVGERTLTILRSARWNREVTVPCPDAVRLFVLAFDTGRYPGLVRGHEASR